MKKMTLFKVFVVLALCLVAVGFYRGWFVLSSHGGSAEGHKIDVNLTVDPDKAKADAKTVEAKAGLTGSTAKKAPHSESEGEAESKDK